MWLKSWMLPWVIEMSLCLFLTLNVADFQSSQRGFAWKMCCKFCSPKWLRLKHTLAHAGDVWCEFLWYNHVWNTQQKHLSKKIQILFFKQEMFATLSIWIGDTCGFQSSHQQKCYGIWRLRWAMFKWAWIHTEVLTAENCLFHLITRHKQKHTHEYR